MRIVTWNINGLRAVTKRGVGDLATLLDSLQAGDDESTSRGAASVAPALPNAKLIS